MLKVMAVNIKGVTVATDFYPFSRRWIHGFLTCKKVPRDGAVNPLQITTEAIMDNHSKLSNTVNIHWTCWIWQPYVSHVSAQYDNVHKITQSQGQPVWCLFVCLCCASPLSPGSLHSITLKSRCWQRFLLGRTLAHSTLLWDSYSCETDMHRHMVGCYSFCMSFGATNKKHSQASLAVSMCLPQTNSGVFMEQRLYSGDAPRQPV